MVRSLSDLLNIWETELVGVGRRGKLFRALLPCLSWSQRLYVGGSPEMAFHHDGCGQSYSVWWHVYVLLVDGGMALFSTA